MSEDLSHQLAYQRGVQAAIWGMPAVSLASLRDAMVRDLGARPGDVVYMSDLPLPRHELPTANDEAPFAIVMLDSRRGPMVVEVPPAMTSGFSFTGSAVDAWMVPLADLGAAGEDRGQGGRYVFLPPDYRGAVPKGLQAVPSPTFDLYVSLRPLVSRRRRFPNGSSTWSASASTFPLHAILALRPAPRRRAATSTLIPGRGERCPPTT